MQTGCSAKGNTWGSEWSLKKEPDSLEESFTKAVQQPEWPPIRGGPSMDFGQPGAGSHSWSGERRHFMRLRPVSIFNAQLAQLSCHMPGVEVMRRILNYTQSRSPESGALSRLLLLS